MKRIYLMEENDTMYNTREYCEMRNTKYDEWDLIEKTEAKAYDYNKRELLEQNTYEDVYLLHLDNGDILKESVSRYNNTLTTYQFFMTIDEILKREG